MHDVCSTLTFNYSCLHVCIYFATGLSRNNQKNIKKTMFFPLFEYIGIHHLNKGSGQNHEKVVNVKERTNWMVGKGGS